MQGLKKKVIYITWAVLFGFGFFLLTTNVFFNYAGGNAVAATIMNTLLITFFVILDKVQIYIYNRARANNIGKKPTILGKILMAYFDGPSVKTSLYLFYVIMLICTALVSADPDLPYLRNLKDYFPTVQYGILILIAADKFVERLLKDIVLQTDDPRGL
jgi:hypothetical protein